MATRQPISRSNTCNSTIRRNLFNQSQSRRPTTAVASETLQITEDNNDDIMIRDADGKCQVLRPPKLEEDEEELVQEALEKDDRKFIELYRTHNRQNTDINELRTAVQASLQAKVASLDEDNWMYEREDKNDPEA